MCFSLSCSLLISLKNNLLEHYNCFYRSSPPIGETLKQLTNQLIDANATDVVLDTRTPPKVKQQQKQKEAIENSHPGIAEPVDEELINLEEATKKLNFYKIEKPTTNSGLSTWILLSGQTPPSTTKVDSNLTLVTDMPNRIVKPIFKKRTTTTRKPFTTTTTTSAPTTTAETEKTTKMNKIKASILSNALHNKKTHNTTLAKQNSTTQVPLSTKSTTTSPMTTTTIISTTVALNKNISANESINAVDSNALPLEAKDTEMELTTAATDVKKTRRPTTNKRKKNKNKRKRPATDKVSNSTKIALKEKPISTQIYNYLSREVMPTVGVGLVGLMVTAGLASYFLYPFGAARRNYNIDRKDKEGSYHYLDDYDSGGIAEEEAIGKVIAGMQSTTTASYINYRRNNAKTSYSSVRYRNVNSQGPNDSYQKKYHASYNGNNDYGVNNNNYQTEPYYNKDVVEQNKETGYMVDDKKFVVGSVSQESFQEVTPVTVPEHGPRSLKNRRRRQVSDIDNEIFSDVTENPNPNSSYSSEFTTTGAFSTTTTTEKHSFSTTQKNNRTEVAPHKSFVNLLKDLFHMKVNFGLQLLHNATVSVARYLGRVQKRLEDHYRSNNSTYTYH